MLLSKKENILAIHPVSRKMLCRGVVTTAPSPKLQTHVHKQEVCVHEQCTSIHQNIYTTEQPATFTQRTLPQKIISKIMHHINTTYYCSTRFDTEYRSQHASVPRKYILPLVYATLLTRSKPCHIATISSSSPDKLQHVHKTK